MRQGEHKKINSKERTTSVPVAGRDTICRKCHDVPTGLAADQTNPPAIGLEAKQVQEILNTNDTNKIMQPIRCSADSGLGKELQEREQHVTPHGGGKCNAVVSEKCHTFQCPQATEQ
jgi:hypothetical protein